MKKIVALLLVFALVLVGCSAGVNQAEYDALDIKLNKAINERDNIEKSLNSEITQLKDEIVVLKEDIKGLSSSSSSESQGTSVEPKPETSANPKTEPPATPAETPSTVKEPEPKSTTSASTTPSIGQRNSLSKAKSYLDYTAFSHTGLIKQLEYEGYSNEDAAYGADNCGANWNEQAAKKAKSYLEYTAFSRSSLIDQLVYEGYTNEQAVYGAEANGY